MSRFFESTFGVYFDDLDMYGVLHNARYLLFVERTLGEFWRHLGWSSFAANPDQFHLVRANHIEYDRPMVGLGDLRVRLTIGKLGNSSMVVNFRLMPPDQDLPYATGYRVLVRIDQDTRRPLAWSEGFRDGLRPYVEVE
ncbi:MAG: acyl-CoA thioesterase [Alphaproteobacteria bacterium]|nr:acyl-CoA thioesterase [Alphaproteobacteria bacterium]MCB9796569.1 acyl-CoA thioesterase [Alphaproteobacteria bacterium]